VSDERDAVTPDPDKGEVLSIWATLAAMTEMSKLAKAKDDDTGVESRHEDNP
jgi:hypothetical protein